MKEWISLSKGLRNTLFQTHLAIALIAVFFLLFFIGAAYYLGENASSLIKVNIPLTKATEDIQTGLQRNLAALRGWISIKDYRFTKARESAWKDEIYPNLIIIKKMSAESDNRNFIKLSKKVESVLLDLQSWEWRIEDVAQTPGNFTARTFLVKNITPLSERIIAYASNIINEESRGKSKGNKTILIHMANFRGHFTRSLVFLISYSESGSSAKRHLSSQELRMAQDSLNELTKENPEFNISQGSDYYQLKKHLASYLNYINEIEKIREGEKSNLAAYWLSSKAMPLSILAEDLIAQMISIQTRDLNIKLVSVSNLFYYLPYAVSLYVLLLLLISTRVSSVITNKILQPILLLLNATKQMAAGKLNADIAVTTHDEIGELTESFNQMRAQRQQAEDKTKAIVETASYPIITINEDAIIQFTNSATCELLGYKEKELVKSNLAMIISRDYQKNYKNNPKAYLQNIINAFLIKAREVEVKSRVGELIPVLLSVSEINVGNERMFTGIFHDMREEKAQSEKLNKLNTKLVKENKEKSLVSELDNQLRGVDDIKEFSYKALRFFSQNFSVLVSAFYLMDEKQNSLSMVANIGAAGDKKNKALSLDDGLIGQCVKSRERMIITGIPKDYYQIATGLGQTMPNELIISPLIFENKVLGVLELGQLEHIDEDELHIIQHLMDNIAVALKITLAKVSLQVLFEKTERQRQYLVQQEEELRSSNEELESQTEAVRQSEDKLLVANSELSTKIKYIEEQQEEIKLKSVALEKTSKYKSEFLANMSHELRTPLNSLLILAQSFVKNKENNLTDTQKEEAGIIYEAGQDLLRLINDVLDISKVEAGKLDVHIEQVKLTDIIQSIERQFRPLAAEKGIEFLIKVHDSVALEYLHTDKVRILQILKNLLSNAFKFTDKGSINLDISLNQSEVLIAVQDTGIGIARGKQRLVFSEFHQADGSTSRKYGGTGLGLSISNKLAHLLDGELRLESEVGKGSIFTLALINNQALKLSNESESLDGDFEPPCTNPIDNYDKIGAYDFNKRSVLIIDDDVSFCEHIQKLARANGFQVLQANKGELGIKLARQFKPSGIILDLGLPDIPGDKVLSELKASDMTADIPVHIISGRDENELKSPLDIITYSQKPVLQEQVDSILASIANDKLKRVLVVEDNTQAQSSVQAILEKFEPIELVFESYVAGASKQLIEQSFDVAIIDLMLPDGTALEMLQALSEKNIKLPPLIIYTARNLTGEEAKQIEKYTENIIIKSDEALERLNDEVSLFLNRVEKDTKNLSSTNEDSNLHSDLLGKVLLLVDDDLRNTFALSRALQSEGLSVLIADNGKLAIEKLKSVKHVDLVLMDMMMPVMDGYDTIKAIRVLENYKRIPIISLTAKATEHDRTACLAAGADDFMSKPIVVDSLLSHMHSLLYPKGEADD